MINSLIILCSFDGWLLNIETKLPTPQHASCLCDFLKFLTDEMHFHNPGSLVLWYDSVTKDGKLSWQNQLNAANEVLTTQLHIYLQLTCAIRISSVYATAFS